MLRKGRSERGSVSVFLIMILAVVYAFVAIFIDYARIAAMKVQSERLVRAAVRSVMSSYDPELQQRYGLFAYGESSGDQIMAGVLNSSMQSGKRSDAIALLPLQLDTSSLEMDRMLGEYDIFNREIGEEMKYKAPIDFTLELMSKFKPLSTSMKEASDTVDMLGKLQKLYDKREKALDDMLDKQRKAAKSAQGIPSLVMNPAGSSIADESLGGISSAADIAAQYNDYVDKVSRDKEEDDDEDTDKDPDPLGIARYLLGSSILKSNIGNKHRSAEQSHSQLLPEALELLEEARDLNNQMKKVIANSTNRPETAGYDEVSAGLVPGTPQSSGDDSEVIRQLREQTDALILSDELFDDLKQGITSQTESFGSVNNELSMMTSELSESSGTTGNAGRMKSSIISARSRLDSYVNKYFASGSGNILDQEAAMLEQHRSSDKERKEKEKQGKAKLKDATNILKTINGLDKKAKGHMEEYKTLQTYFDDSMAFNEQTDEGDRQGQDLDDDPYDAGKSSMNDMDGLYGGMARMMSGLQDELFQNEYAALYFKHFDITQLKEAAANPGSSIGDAVVDQLSVNNQELEYIVYGFHNPVGNISAAYAEIFGVRLAIRTMEGFVVNSKLGNPLLILAAALLYGIEMAIADMITLCTKGSVELSRYVKVELTYKDYLRLFLLIHSNNKNKMSRMLSLIRLNTGINPAERATYASGEVRIGMRLWFLPGVMKVIGYTGGSLDEVEGNRYYVTKKADFSY